MKKIIILAALLGSLAAFNGVSASSYHAPVISPGFINYYGSLHASRALYKKKQRRTTRNRRTVKNRGHNRFCHNHGGRHHSHHHHRHHRH